MSRGKGGRGMVAVSVTMILFFMWALWVSVSHQGRRGHYNRLDYDEESPPGFVEKEERVSSGVIEPNSKKSGKKPGIIVDLNKHSKKFKIQGFHYFRKSPLRDKRLKKAESVWILANRAGESSKASISIGGLQKNFSKNKRRNKNKLKDVFVVIKYHLHWAGISVTVTGTDVAVKEQIVETLPVHDEEHYCTAIIYLGQVNEVKLEANASAAQTHFIIDELQVAVGSELFDDLEEVTCH